MSTDPVCGMEVFESMAPAKIDYEGITYYFCSHSCLGTFQDNPGKFVGDSILCLY